MLCQEVFEPIGIPAAPVIRTREGAGRRGLVLFNAGYYPTLDDLAKIALLYQRAGEWGGWQILHRDLTQRLLAADGALCKSGDPPLVGVGSAASARPNAAATHPDDARTRPHAVGICATGPSTHYKMGFHFTPYASATGGPLQYLPSMWGVGESEVFLYPNGTIFIRVAKFTESVRPPAHPAR
jgi:hypothetical protein